MWAGLCCHSFMYLSTARLTRKPRIGMTWGRGWGRSPLVPSVIKPLKMRGQVIFPWCHPPSCHHPASPLQLITLPTTTEVERISLKAHISEEIASGPRTWPSKGGWTTKRRLSLNLPHLCCFSFPCFLPSRYLFSSPRTFPWEPPFLPTWRCFHHPFYLPKP